MKITDAHAIVNELRTELTGRDALDTITTADLIDTGKTLQQMGIKVEQIYQKIADKVGKMVVKNKVYNAKFPSLLKDSWEFGSILETLRVRLFEAKADPSQNPTAGNYPLTNYEPADIVAKYFTDYDNFQYIYWKPTDQLWGAFNSMDEMVRFLGAIETAVENSLSINVQGLSKTAQNNFAANVIDHGSGMQKVNLLTLYNANQTEEEQLVAEEAIKDPKFLRFAVERITTDKNRLSEDSVLFNLEMEDTFTTQEDLELVVLDVFANSIKINMQSDTYHKELVELPNYEEVSCWQGTGTSYSWDSISKIDVAIKTYDSQTGTEGTKDVVQDGIVAYMFDRNGVGVNCERRKVTTFYHPDLDQTKFFDKYFAQYYNDFSENFIVYIVADE